MNSPTTRNAMQVRSLLLLVFFSFSFFLQAQVSIPRFQVNFQSTTPSSKQISFNIEDNDGSIDFIVMKNNEPIFRFTNIDYNTESLYSFVLVDNKEKAIEGLNQQTTLTTDSSFGPEILLAFQDKNTTMIGILECTTKTGATSRMQIIKLMEEEDENAVVEVNK